MARLRTDKVFICTSEGECSEHGKFIYYCFECHERWRETHPLTVASIAAMADPKVSHSKAMKLMREARKAEPS